VECPPPPPRDPIHPKRPPPPRRRGKIGGAGICQTADPPRRVVMTNFTNGGACRQLGARRCTQRQRKPRGCSQGFKTDQMKERLVSWTPKSYPKAQVSDAQNCISNPPASQSGPGLITSTV